MRLVLASDGSGSGHLSASSECPGVNRKMGLDPVGGSDLVTLPKRLARRLEGILLSSVGMQTFEIKTQGTIQNNLF